MIRNACLITGNYRSINKIRIKLFEKKKKVKFWMKKYTNSFLKIIISTILFTLTPININYIRSFGSIFLMIQIVSGFILYLLHYCPNPLIFRSITNIIKNYKWSFRLIDKNKIWYLWFSRLQIIDNKNPIVEVAPIKIKTIIKVIRLNNTHE